MLPKWMEPASGFLFVLLFCLIAGSIAGDQIFSDDSCPSSTHYQCHDRLKCIPKAYLCNANIDCPDGDDEVECGKLGGSKIKFFHNLFTLPTLEMKLCTGDSNFLCRDKSRCILKSLTCDNVADCPDNSDESDTMCDPIIGATGQESTTRKPCSSDQFECGSRTCIPKKLMCDGVKHCFDGSDEEPKLCADKNVG